MSRNDDLLWRVEMACRAAWPAAEEYESGGWQFRFTDDATRRTGSLNPLPGAEAPDAALLAEAEAYYAERGYPAFVRLPDFLGLDDRAMLARGYGREGPTRTLYTPLIDAETASADIELTDRMTDDWLSARTRMAGGSAQSLAATLKLITAPACFSLSRDKGEVVSIAYGVVLDGCLVLEAVATDPRFRGRGHARAMLAALMSRARAQGARDAALQVVAGNEPALSLYGRLGFAEDLYGYCYYRQPG
ncbi:GNAT family N-acetyltransferase [Pseudohoeflea suaedae]|nr:GNAT family N-acetyltransferase [Pseudohoeflea suaedae]